MENSLILIQHKLIWQNLRVSTKTRLGKITEELMLKTEAPQNAPGAGTGQQNAEPQGMGVPLRTSPDAWHCGSLALQLQQTAGRDAAC